MARRWRGILVFAGTLILLLCLYVRSRPDVFNESFLGHAHCIAVAGMELLNYASAHSGKFPYSPEGYGNALLLLPEEIYHALTGPGYGSKAFFDAKGEKKNLSEEECGRVYVQGLTVKSNPNIALLFDKHPTPGGD